MVRVNLVNPSALTDEHLFAENVELQMLFTFINKYPDGYIPDKYCLGKGHMSFFRNKRNFIKYRRRLILKEVCKRQRKNYYQSADCIRLNWQPNSEDIKLNTDRIIDRLLNPIRKKNNWHYYGKEIKNIKQFISDKYE